VRELSRLVDVIQCPRCGRNSGRMEVEAFRGVSMCYRSDCLQRWWVMWLHAGDVESQLVPVFGVDLARANMATWKLPMSLSCGKYWQLSLSRRVYDEHHAGGSVRLLNALVELFRARGHLVGPTTQA
jgi:hypothetical protein